VPCQFRVAVLKLVRSYSHETLPATEQKETRYWPE